MRNALVGLVPTEPSPEALVSESEQNKKASQPPRGLERRLQGAPDFRRLRGGRMAGIWTALAGPDRLRRALPRGWGLKNMETLGPWTQVLVALRAN